MFSVIYLFYHDIESCVYSLESPHRGDSNEYTQHTIIAQKIEKSFPKLLPFASWPGTMINVQWLELPISRTNVHGPQDVGAIAVRLYVLRYLLYKDSVPSNIDKPQCEKAYLLTCAPDEDSNQPANPRNLIRLFLVCIMKPCTLSYPKCA